MWTPLLSGWDLTRFAAYEAMSILVLLVVPGTWVFGGWFCGLVALFLLARGHLRTHTEAPRPRASPWWVGGLVTMCVWVACGLALGWLGVGFHTWLLVTRSGLPRSVTVPRIAGWAYHHTGSAAAVVGAGTLLVSSHRRQAQVPSAPAPFRATMSGRTLAVGGPVGAPRPWSHQPFRLVALRSGRVVHVGRTDRAGRFVIHVPDGYMLSLSTGLVVETMSEDVELDRHVLHVKDARTIRPRVVVTTPLWA